MPHLYNTLFNVLDDPHSDADDITMEIINQLHNHTDLNSISKYYDVTTYNTLFDPRKHLNILHLNSRSLPKNIDNIKAFLNSLIAPPDVLAITETWLSETNKELFQLSGYQSYHLVRTIRPQGGVSVYISNNIQSTQIKELTLINDNIEMNTTKITIDSNSFVIIAIYRPHSKHEGVEAFTNNLITLLQRENIKKSNVVVIGDININLLEHSAHTATNNYLAALQTINFFPHISRPTRFPDTVNLSEPSLLDHVYTNFNNSFVSGIIHYQVSDHLPIFLNISTPPKPLTFHKIEFRIFNQNNKQNFTNEINLINWNDLFTSDDVNINFQTFLSTLQQLYNQCFPIVSKQISEKRLNSPWINQEILNAIKTKNKLYKDFKIGVVPEEQYKQYRNSLNNKIKQIKQSYFINKFTNFKNNTSKIWDTVNQLTNKNHRNKDIHCINYNNKKLTEVIDIAKTFNEFYTNIACKLDNNLPPPTTDPLTFLAGNYPSSMAIPTIYPQDVIPVINSLKNRKCNIHEIAVSIIKLNSQHFAIPLTILFNHSITSGIFPQLLKHATVVPIHKNGSKEELGNYRPISLLSNFSKIFEKLMKKFLINYLNTKKVINSRQYGFQSGLSTFDALSTFSEEIYSTLESRQSLLSIYIDFTKAFDTVQHDILLKKLKFYGIRGIIYDWFRTYLSERTQSVKLSQHVSTSKIINYGVPQGSVLGPILFLLYINDLPSIFTHLRAILFADDATLYTTGEDTRNMIYTANNDLKILYTWCLSNRMTINLDKTYYMIFTNKECNNLPSLLYHNNTIQITNTHTLLGIKFDDSMTFRSHISNLILKLSRIVAMLYRVKDYMPTKVLKILYDAHVLPHLQYCSPIWSSTYPTHLLPLFRLQKKIIRIITNSDYFAHTQPLFKTSNILKIYDINRLQIAIYMFKLLRRSNNTTLLPLHNYPTRTHTDLRLPLHTLTLYQHSLSYLGPKTWNALPNHIKTLPTLISFKKQLKKHIISQYITTH